MIIKYEALEEKDGETTFKDVASKDATYKHTCYHDEGKGRPCKREKI